MILIGHMFFLFFSAAKGAGMVGKAAKFMLGMGVTATTAAGGGATIAGTWGNQNQLTLFHSKCEARESKCEELRGLLNVLKSKIDAEKVKRDKTFPGKIGKLKVKN